MSEFMKSAFTFSSQAYCDDSSKSTPATTDMPAPTTMPTKAADVDPNAPVQDPNAAAPAGNVE